MVARSFLGAHYEFEISVQSKVKLIGMSRSRNAALICCNDSVRCAV